MAENKKAFIVYTDWKKYIDDLNDKQVGQWIRWVFEYCNDKWKNKDSQIEYPKDATVKMLCLMTKDVLKRDLRKYESKVDSISKAREKRKYNIEINNEINNEIKTDVNNDFKTVNSNKLLVNSNKLLEESKDSNIKKSSIKEKSTTSRFVPPTPEEIKTYCDSRNNLVDVNRFYDFYQSKGWMVGKNKMKDWKAAIRTWEKDSGFKTKEEDIDLKPFIKTVVDTNVVEFLENNPQLTNKQKSDLINTVEDENLKSKLIDKYFNGFMMEYL